VELIFHAEKFLIVFDCCNNLELNVVVNNLYIICRIYEIQIIKKERRLGVYKGARREKCEMLSSQWMERRRERKKERKNIYLSSVYN
jgi:hypothetical protein